MESTIGTKVEIEKIQFSWPNGLRVKNIYMEDQKSDTLFFAEHLYAGIDYLALLHGEFEIGSVELDNAVANVVVSEADSSFNFDYIIEAFSPNDSTKTTNPAADTSAMDIDISSLEISQTRFNYLDNASGMDMSYSIGRLYISTQEFDIQQNIFFADEIELENSTAEILIFKQSQEDSIKSTLPKMKVGAENLLVQNTDIRFRSIPDQILVKSSIGELIITAEPIFLNKQTIHLNTAELSNSKILFKQGVVLHVVSAVVESTNNNEEWKITLDQFETNKVSLAYQDKNIQSESAGLQFADLNIALMHSEINDIYFMGADSLGAKVNALNLYEKSGLGIEKMQGNLSMEPTSIKILDLYLKTKNSLIQRDFILSYPSLESISENIYSLGLDLNIQQSYIAFEDILLFMPSLAKNQSLGFLKNKQIQLDGNLNGSIDHLQIQQLHASIAGSTVLELKGQIKNISDPNNLEINLPVLNLKTTSEALLALLPDSTIPNTIQLPPNMALKAAAAGKIKNMEASVDLQTTFGNLIGDFQLQSTDSSWQSASYFADLEIPSFELNRFLKDSTFGNISFAGEVEGKGLTAETIYAELDAKIYQFEYQDYQYSDLNIDGLLDRKKFSGQMQMNDSNLIFTFDGLANLDTNNMEYKFTLDLIAVDLQHLGLHEEDVRLKGLISSNIEGTDLNNINGNVELRDFMIVHNGENYPVDSLLFVSITDSGKTDIEIQSTILSGNFKGTINLAEIYPTLKDHLYTYISGKDVMDSKTSEQNFEFSLVIHDEDILTDILVPDLDRFVTGTLEGSYNSNQKKLDLQLYFPLIEYQNIIIDSLYLVAESNAEHLHYILNLDRLSYDTLSLNNVLLEGLFKNDSLINTFTISENSGESFFQLASAVTGFKESMKMVFLDRTIFDYNSWDVDPKNQIIFGDELKIENLRFSRAQEFISINTPPSGNENNIHLEFGNFQLENFTEIIITEEVSQNRFGLEDWDTTKVDTSEVKEEHPLLEGIVDGEIQLPLDSSSAITADIQIIDIKSSGIPIGDISIKADELSRSKQSILANLSGMGNDMEIKGNVSQRNTENHLELVANIKQLQLKSIEPFLTGALKNSEGYFSGEAEIKGTMSEPKYGGYLNLSNISVTPTYLGTTYRIPDERISFNNSKIELDNFLVYDSLNNSFVLDGEIMIEKISNPEFNLQLNSDNFILLNTSRENENDLFYGNIIVSSEIKITGNLDEPVILANLDLEKGSKLTFIVPNTQTVSVEQEGLVEFVDMDSDIPSLLTENKNIDTVKMDVLGLDLEAFVSVDPETEITIVIDPVTGDHLLLKGGGDFRTSVDPTGKIAINGLYEIKEGSYELRLYNLVRRKFEIQPGSNIIWNGDPLSAEMDIRAIYEVKTSPIDLLGSQVTQLSEEQRFTYNQKLDFEVILLLNGELMQPEIAFEIQLEEDDRGAMGGIVLSKLNEINNNPSELNKQAFALLVFKRFISQDPFASNENAGLNIARQSVSRLLNQQLNNLTGGDIKGIQIELNIDSYQDYNTEGEEIGRTEVGVALSKSLFDERVLVKVNNDFDVENQGVATQRENSSSFAGDVSIEYLITEDGKYRIKFYRDNNYEGIIEGQLIETGVSLIFAKDYESFHDLFKKNKKPEKIKQEEEEVPNEQ